jgi:hypothetical protein
MLFLMPKLHFEEMMMMMSTFWLDKVMTYTLQKINSISWIVWSCIHYLLIIYPYTGPNLAKSPPPPPFFFKVRERERKEKRFSVKFHILV